MVASIVLVLVEIGWIALLMQAARFVLQFGLDLDPDIALALSAAGFVGYTVIGGQKAVVRTDVVQMVLAVIALGAILVGLLVQGGGIRPSSLTFPVSTGQSILIYPKHHHPSIPRYAFLTLLLRYSSENSAARERSMRSTSLIKPTVYRFI